MQWFVVIGFNIMFREKINYKRFHCKMKAFICVCSPTLPNLCTGCSAGLKCVYYIFNIPYMSDCRTCTLLSILSSNTIKPSLTCLGRFYILFLSSFHLISTAIFKITLFYFISQFVCVSH